jgi:hypothetical protein
MRRLSFGSVLSAVALATAAVVPVLASPAGATTSCPEIGEYPAIQASQSNLRVACDFDNPGGVSNNFTIHDFQNAVWHNGSARTVTTTAATANGSAVITASAGHFTAADISAVVSGTNVPARAFIISVTSTTATMDVPACAASPTCAIGGPIPIGQVISIENSTARTVKDGVTTAGGAVVTSATAHFTSADVGKSLSGTTIPDGRTIASVTSTTATLNSGTGVTAGSAQVLSIGASQENTDTRQVSDATSTTTTITSASAKFSATDDVGLAVTGSGIVGDKYIVSVSGNVATLGGTGTVTANATPHIVAIGKPSATAPKDGDAVATLASILDLNPSLVAGSNACSLNKPEGFTIQGTWHNAGTFAAVTFPTTPPAGSLIGQFQFNTAVITFAMYVQQTPAATASDPQVTSHYDLLAPNLPTALAKCPTPSTVPIGLSLGFAATTASQSNVKTGVGKPSSAQVRALRANNGPALTTTGYMKSNLTTAGMNWSFSQNCVMANPIVVDFHCGNG